MSRFTASKPTSRDRVYKHCKITVPSYPLKELGLVSLRHVVSAISAVHRTKICVQGLPAYWNSFHWPTFHDVQRRTAGSKAPMFFTWRSRCSADDTRHRVVACTALVDGLKPEISMPKCHCAGGYEESTAVTITSSVEEADGRKGHGDL